jgi:DNA-binding LacI/PurR family transcriptional regulator
LGSNTIGLLIAGLDPFYLPLIRGVEEVADEHGMLVVIADTQDSPERAAATIRRLIARGVDGLIAVSLGDLDRGDLAEWVRRPVPPIVYVDQPGPIEHAFVFDAQNGGRLATEHLLEHGHERIGMVTAPVEWANVAPLHEGYVQALAGRGIDVSRERIAQVPAFSLEAGRSGLARLLDLPDPPTAVFAASSSLALGTLDEARRRGVRIPEDLALVGYTDIETATLVEPPLTMVSVPAREIGVRAADALRRLIGGEAVAPDPIVLDVELVVRSSCGSHEPIRSTSR